MRRFLIGITILLLSCHTSPRDNQAVSIPESMPEYSIPLYLDYIKALKREDTGQDDLILYLSSLSAQEFREMLTELIPPYFTIISSHNELIVFYEDLNQDNRPELIVLAVTDYEKKDGNQFTQFSNLYNEDFKPHMFNLLILTYSNNSFTLINTIELGKKFIYGGFSHIQIDKNNDVPFILSVLFQTLKGTEHVWLIFQGNSFEPVSNLNLEDTASNHLMFKDINKDGILDIVIEDKGPVEGLGYETFLTWLKWDGTRFVEYANTNIIRNLKIFLDNVKEDFLNNNWENLINMSFRKQDIQRYQNTGYGLAYIIYVAFHMYDVYSTEGITLNDVLDNIKDIFFPEIFENPFLVQDDEGFYFNITFRILDRNGISFISEVPLYMNENPFDPHQFFFFLP